MVGFPGGPTGQKPPGQTKGGNLSGGPVSGVSLLDSWGPFWSFDGHAKRIVQFCSFTLDADVTAIIEEILFVVNGTL